MPKSIDSKQHTEHHKDGSIWAKGYLVDSQPDGYWEWFRKDGSKMRSGHFQKGQQVGEWVTYDKASKIYKVTLMKKGQTQTKPNHNIGD